MPESQDRRPAPEQLLKRVEAEERHQVRGKLKIFLGYASGVGKSFRMLDEGRRRRERGEEVVVAAAQPVTTPELEDLLRGFEVIPPRTEVDVPAVLRRRPEVCLIDGLAYDNPSGAKNPHRWQDVEELIEAGISVITSINLQYIRERQAEVERIRGRVVRECVPEAFIRTADEIEIVDAPPEYAATRSGQANGTAVALSELDGRLSELREIALLLAAEVVDYQLEQYLQRQGIEQRYGTHERVLVCITPRSNASVMIRRGRRQADRFHGELHVVYVDQDETTVEDRNRIDRHLSLAREANAEVHVLRGEDPVRCILSFAEQHGITQIFVGHSQRHGWLDRLRPNPVERLILETEGMDVRIFPNAEFTA
jgi:two-component system sensor histidine kinase KdpD